MERTIEAKIIPNARKIAVEQDGDKFRVHVMALAVEGKANKALIEVLAEFLHLKKKPV